MGRVQSVPSNVGWVCVNAGGSANSVRIIGLPCASTAGRH